MNCFKVNFWLVNVWKNELIIMGFTVTWHKVEDEHTAYKFSSFCVSNSLISCTNNVIIGNLVDFTFDSILIVIAHPDVAFFFRFFQSSSFTKNLISWI